MTEKQSKLNNGDKIHMYEVLCPLKDLEVKQKTWGLSNTIGAVSARALYTQNQITQARGSSSLAGKNSPCSPDAEQIGLEKYGNC